MFDIKKQFDHKLLFCGYGTKFIWQSEFRSVLNKLKRENILFIYLVGPRTPLVGPRPILPCLDCRVTINPTYEEIGPTGLD